MISVMPTPDNIMKDVHVIVAKEVERLKLRALQGLPFTQNDTMQLRQYVIILLELGKEERSQEEFERMQKLSDEELKELVSTLFVDKLLAEESNGCDRTETVQNQKRKRK